MSTTETLDWIYSRTEPTGAQMAPAMYRFIADKLEADPALLQIGLDNIARWLAQGHDAVKWFGQWRALILEAQASPAGLKKLLDLMRDESWEAMYFKEFEPFCGVMTPEERRQFLCSSAH